jgi:hypothetical protein
MEDCRAIEYLPSRRPIHPNQTSPGDQTNLTDGVPDGLEESVALSQPVHSIVALAHGADKAAEGVDVVLALDGTAVLVDLGDGELDGSVVLGLDDAVGGAALARDVTEEEEDPVSSQFLPSSLHPSSRVPYRSTISPLSFSIVAAGVWCC